MSSLNLTHSNQYLINNFNHSNKNILNYPLKYKILKNYKKSNLNNINNIKFNNKTIKSKITKLNQFIFLNKILMKKLKNNLKN